jgi:hypothetical protein
VKAQVRIKYVQYSTVLSVSVVGAPVCRVLMVWWSGGDLELKPVGS